MYPCAGVVQTKIQKWGNSLGLRIPRSFAAEVQVGEGSTVDITLEQGCLRVRPVRNRKYLLSELVEGIRPRNRHADIPTGPAVGREIW